MDMLQTFSERQQVLMKYLLYSKQGATMDQLTKALVISRNAVNQHLVTLESAGIVSSSPVTRPRGRPCKLYNLTGKGREFFTRHYTLFAVMLLKLIRKRIGAEKLDRAMKELGRDMANEYLSRTLNKSGREARMLEIANIMYELGYETQYSVLESSNGGGHAPEIIASNCVFHELAAQNSEICQMDLSFMSALLGENIELKECMMSGGQCCRFVRSNSTSNNSSGV